MELYSAFIIVDNTIIWTHLGNDRIICQNKLLDKLDDLGKPTRVLPAINGKGIFVSPNTSIEIFKHSY